MLDVDPLGHLCQGNALAHMPELTRLCQAVCHHGVGDAAVGQRGFKQALKLRTGVVLGFVIRVFKQHAPGALAPQWHAQLRHMTLNQAEGKLPHELKAGQARAQMSVRQPQQGQRLRQRRHCGPGRQPGRWQWVELECGRRDDAQGALGADHQVAQVVAGVVLAKT